MNKLDTVTLNSVNLIDQRLELLQRELAEIEKEFVPLRTEKPPGLKIQDQRYQELPSIEPEPAKVLTIKPQIKEEYLRSLQYVPDIISEYSDHIQEPQYIKESTELITPPRLVSDNSILYSYLQEKIKQIDI
jgi:hypothetical protein